MSVAILEAIALQPTVGFAEIVSQALVTEVAKVDEALANLLKAKNFQQAAVSLETLFNGTATSQHQQRRDLAVQIAATNFLNANKMEFKKWLKATKVENSLRIESNFGQVGYIPSNEEFETVSNASFGALVIGALLAASNPITASVFVGSSVVGFFSNAFRKAKKNNDVETKEMQERELKNDPTNLRIELNLKKFA